MFARYARRALNLGAVAAAATATGLALYNSDFNRTKQALAETAVLRSTELPTRAQQLKSLRETKQFDVLIIGAGATGAGVALDAVTRGLSTALVERDDFSSGTSSRSTKLIHGGVRYLQKAVFNLDYEQFKLVKEALHERANLLEIAPHLSGPLPIMLPVYKLWQLPYFWSGIKMYDLIAGTANVKTSYVLSPEKTLEAFPMLKREDLVGSIVYYDGQHNDARMNISIALTAAERGATVANHVEVQSLLKEIDPSTGKERVCGATVRDTITGDSWDVRAKCVINATGPFCEGYGHCSAKLWRSHCAPELLQNMTIAGTTDAPTKVSANPMPTEEEIDFILNEVRHYLSPDVQVRRGDVLAAWSGIRPLVSDPDSANTQSIVRNHLVHVSDSKLVTISGGKWTTYRTMAIDTVDAAIAACNLKPERGCQTDGLMLMGGAGYTPTMFIRLVQDYGLDVEVAQHLANTYGDRAGEVALLATITGRRWPVVGRRLAEEYPYIEAEVRYAIREYACTAVDVLARRTRLAFLNVQAALQALPSVIQIMSKELNWTEEQCAAEKADAEAFLQTMGLAANTSARSTKVPVKFNQGEISELRREFDRFDLAGTGHISAIELRKVLDSMGEEVSENQLHELISEVDFNQNSTIEFDEFLQLMSALRTGAVSNSRLATIFDKGSNLANRIPVHRSGGGV
ncbi:glycerol-3-phosphate dehydrogenase 2 [Capsaspora owczarzaki ATCC 30864]|uniref:glycerol-3-phosphate dehydrogenase 2 n=1 Tax=Capsaspora owczarzaki (strain ATCC 30864) TaxID=595528 RepID=UPI000352163F|nr:glycerol-3-phosphate dehydrogenase 2 [Capsaspora owczarzaki ATCC 30864]|eukprot:XP_004345777.2 glycerol-3-phosphate dehydrogenase 2 [Capsaspora owczarzaki ATCC 30864]